MGRLFLQEFDEAVPDHYMCRWCRTPIAQHKDHYTPYAEPGFHGNLFFHTINLQVDRPQHHRQVGAHTVADVYCVKCGHKLGWKYIEVDPEQMNVWNNLEMLDMTKLLRNHGGEILDGGRLMVGVPPALPPNPPALPPNP